MKQRGSESSWTDVRVQVQRTIEKLSINIKSLNIHEFAAIEFRVVNHFTGDKQFGFSWMWENRILKSFSHFTHEISDFSVLSDVLTNVIETDERVWLFLEDSYRQSMKFWGYTGDIKSIVTLLCNLPFCDFYIVSKKLKWVTGQNHHDILFGYGEISEKLKSCHM